MVERFARFSLAIFEISRCWHRLAAGDGGLWTQGRPRYLPDRHVPL